MINNDEEREEKVRVYIYKQDLEMLQAKHPKPEPSYKLIRWMINQYILKQDFNKQFKKRGLIHGNYKL